MKPVLRLKNNTTYKVFDENKGKFDKSFTKLLGKSLKPVTEAFFVQETLKEIPEEEVLYPDSTDD